MIRYTLIESGGIKNENDKIAHKSEQEIISTMKKQSMNISQQLLYFAYILTHFLKGKGGTGNFTKGPVGQNCSGSQAPTHNMALLSGVEGSYLTRKASGDSQTSDNLKS